MYYQPFFNSYVKNKYVKFTGGLSRYWDYQITNDRGNYETVNFTEPKVALSISSWAGLPPASKVFRKRADVKFPVPPRVINAEVAGRRVQECAYILFIKGIFQGIVNKTNEGIVEDIFRRFRHSRETAVYMNSSW